MPIPDFQTLMLPVLQIAGDAQEHIMSDVIDSLATYFKLTDEEKSELLPSGRQAKFDNRVHWARTYLLKAGLLESTGWGRFRITQTGLEVLRSEPNRIDKRFLERFAAFQEFQAKSKPQNEHGSVEVEELTQTPEEILEASYQNLSNQLAQELLQYVMSCSPKFFETLVVDLLVAMGYGGSRKDAGQAIGRSGDDGVDGMINEDRLGLDVVYIQAKRWDANSTVGRPTVQAFAGSIEGFRARKGVFITTAQFSREAREYVGRIEKKIVLIDGEQLAQLMMDYGIGVSEVATYIVRKVDSDYFGTEA